MSCRSWRPNPSYRWSIDLWHHKPGRIRELVMHDHSKRAQREPQCGTTTSFLDTDPIKDEGLEFIGNKGGGYSSRNWENSSGRTPAKKEISPLKNFTHTLVWYHPLKSFKIMILVQMYHNFLTTMNHVRKFHFDALLLSFFKFRILIDNLFSTGSWNKTFNFHQSKNLVKMKRNNIHTGKTVFRFRVG